MAKLTAAQRDAIPADKFLGPGRSFPGNDLRHVRAAIPGATRSQHAENISASTADSIKAKARKILRFHKGKKS